MGGGGDLSRGYNVLFSVRDVYIYTVSHQLSIGAILFPIQPSSLPSIDDLLHPNMVRSHPILELKLSNSSFTSSNLTLSDTDYYERFTATGRPMPGYYRSAWTSACMFGPTAPDFLPFRFTDDSIIPVVVRVCEESFKTRSEA